MHMYKKGSFRQIAEIWFTHYGFVACKYVLFSETENRIKYDSC